MVDLSGSPVSNNIENILDYNFIRFNLLLLHLQFMGKADVLKNNFDT